MPRRILTMALAAFVLFVGGRQLWAADAPEAPGTAAAERKQTWLDSEFRCRAISTMKLRTCRFEQKEEKVTITFPNADITCAVEFDEHGDPSRLTGCRSSWLKIPATAKLRKSKKRPVWSGSHKGWTWRDSGEAYCCPGMWITAPKALRAQPDARP